MRLDDRTPSQVPFVVAECKLRQETKTYYHTFPNAGGNQTKLEDSIALIR